MITYGIFGHYGNENLGDEAIITACIQRLGPCMPGTQIVLFSSRPADSETRYSLTAFPISRQSRTSLAPSEQLARERKDQVDHTGAPLRHDPESESRLKRQIKAVPFVWPTLRWFRYLPQHLRDLVDEIRFASLSRKRVKSLDLLIVAGSNQFLDNFGGPWRFPYTLLKWTLLARSAGVPVAYASVGAGPLDSPLSRKMVRLAVTFAGYLSFRDEASRDLVDPGNQRQAAVFPDLAFAIDSPGRHAKAASADSSLVVAVNPMPVYDARYWYDKDPAKYRHYVTRITEFVRNLIEQGRTPLLFATQTKDENVVADVSRGLLDHGYSETKVRRLFTPLESVNDLLSFLEDVDVVVPTRFHGTVLGLWAVKPTIGICYYRKATDLLHEFGQGRFAFDIDRVTVGELCGAVDAVAAGHAAISRTIREHLDQCRRDLETQFESISALVPGKTR